MIRIAICGRKSPGASDDEYSASREKQFAACRRRIDMDFDVTVEIVEFFDEGVSGDDPVRPELQKVFDSLDDWDYVYFEDVDRYGRFWGGLMWFHEYFAGVDQPMLRFVNGVPDLYVKSGNEYEVIKSSGERMIDPDSYMIFGMMLMMAARELYSIRARQRRGINRIMADPELRKEKYKGRPRSND